MRYVLVGNTSSEVEFQQVIANCKEGEGQRRRIEDLVEFINMVCKCDEPGSATHSMKSGKWRTTAADPDVLLYFRDGRGDDVRLWAAVILTEAGVVLLKMVDSFRGGEREREGLLADALDRKARGTVIQGKMP